MPRGHVKCVPKRRATQMFAQVKTVSGRSVNRHRRAESMEGPARFAAVFYHSNISGANEFSGAGWGANGGRHRATPGHMEPLSVQLDSPPGHTKHSLATARKCLLSSRPQVRILLGGAIRNPSSNRDLSQLVASLDEPLTSFVPHSCHAESDPGASGYSLQAPAGAARPGCWRSCAGVRRCHADRSAPPGCSRGPSGP